jgi:hypothetical protein
MEYAKIIEKNNWGNIEYYICKNKRVLFNDQQKVRVRWPNGSETEETLKLRAYEERIHDMGQAYDNHSEKAVLETKMRGLDIDVSVSGLELCVADLILEKKK